MQEKIIVPLDGSKVAEAVLPYVEEIAAKMYPDTMVDVTLMKVIPATKFNIPTRDRSAQAPQKPDELEEIHKEALQYLEMMAESLRPKFSKVNTLVAIGKTAEEIVNAAMEKKADVIAMSTHGFSGIKRLALGSVTEEVVRISDVPVLIVRGK